MSLLGANIVAGRDSAEGTQAITSIDPRTGAEGGVRFHEATASEVAAACAAAAEAAAGIRVPEPGPLVDLLRTIATNLEDVGDELLEVADAETALGTGRLTGERDRTCGQLRAFADLVDDGWHLEVIIDRADEARPDVRRMLVPVGPVAVFGASNFPLAFSVPGGDVASALAAGCPVVAKAHPSHPGTSEVCGRAITAAVQEVGLHPGTFSMVQGRGTEVGRALVEAPEIRAVAFTGSHRGGRALHDLAAARPTPIPVYAEMGSTNPVFVSSSAVRARGPEIARDLAASLALGCGQFCTKPGLVFVPVGEDAFVEQLAAELAGAEAAAMLNPGIREAFITSVERTSALDGVEVVLAPTTDTQPGLWTRGALLQTDLDSFRRHAQLREEHFGPAGIVVRLHEHEMPEAAALIEGSLAASIYLEPSDEELHSALRDELVRMAGRIVFDGVPTGVAVVGAMHHGGPYPATTSLHTSVGTTAVRRFLRPIAYQNAPGHWLPPALRD